MRVKQRLIWAGDGSMNLVDWINHIRIIYQIPLCPDRGLSDVAATMSSIVSR
jgi:hypothetical protein